MNGWRIVLSYATFTVAAGRTGEFHMNLLELEGAIQIGARMMIVSPPFVALTLTPMHKKNLCPREGASKSSALRISLQQSQSITT